MSTLLDTARAYVAAGLSLVPVLLDGTKKPAVAWKAFQSRTPTEAELTAWFDRDEPYGVALVHGEVSGFSEVIDIESDTAYKEFRQLCEDHGRIGLLMLSTVHVVTPTGGRHLYYRCPDGIAGNLKLARFADKSVKIETRGEGGYTVAPGSPVAVHPLGEPYQFADLFDSLDVAGFDVPEISGTDRAFLLAMASACNEFIEPEKIHQPKQPGGAKAPGTRLGDDFNVRGDILPTLLKNGWQEAGRRYGPNGEVIDLTRAGKSVKAGTSATLGYVGTNVLYVFSSNADPFESGRAYKPFSVFGLLEHGGNFGAATKDLAGQGFGEQRPRGVAINLDDLLTDEKQSASEPSDEKAVGGDEIPRAAGKDANGRPMYQAWQIVQIIGKGLGYVWDVAAPDTHAAHAYRLARFSGDNLRYCPELGWLFWEGKHWQTDDKESTATIARAATLSRQIRAEAIYLLDLQKRLVQGGRDEDAGAMAKAAQELLKHAGKAEAYPFLSGTLALAADKLRVSWRTFEPTPWVIGFDNGTWDQGFFREHRREDFMLSVSPVVYDPNADRSEWYALLERMTAGDASFARTLQQVVGYIFSGASHLRLIPWAYGPRGSGKSTYAELLKTVLGREAVAVDNQYLSGALPRERLGALLWGKRFAMNGEAGQQRMDAEALKQLSGGDTLPVRFLYKEPFDAPPRHALLMVANDPPELTAYDDALKSRVKVLPLTHSLIEPEQVKLTGGVRVEAVRQMPTSPLVLGFLSWGVDGLADVFETQDVFLAPIVRTATASFWKDTDPLTGFWETVPVDDLEAGITKSDLRSRYEDWCGKEGVRRPLSPKMWAKACETQGLSEYKGTGGTRYWFRETKPSGTSGGRGTDSQNLYSNLGTSRVGFTENTPLVPLVPLSPNEVASGAVVIEEGEI